jgi:hypothetical protein
MRTIAIYGGRFHPFHKGHKAAYDYLVDKYGVKNVFVATSDSQSPLTSPFSFVDKRAQMIFMGVPESKIFETKQPYLAPEITKFFDPLSTKVVFALSEKDRDRFSFKKKDGSPTYMQPLDERSTEPFEYRSYLEVVPTYEFSLNGNTISSASEIRDLYIGSDNTSKVSIIKELYGKYSSDIKKMFDKKLRLTECANIILDACTQRSLTEDIKLTALAEKILDREDDCRKQLV